MSSKHNNLHRTHVCLTVTNKLGHQLNHRFLTVKTKSDQAIKLLQEYCWHMANTTRSQLMPYLVMVKNPGWSRIHRTIQIVTKSNKFLLGLCLTIPKIIKLHWQHFSVILHTNIKTQKQNLVKDKHHTKMQSL